MPTDPHRLPYLIVYDWETGECFNTDKFKEAKVKADELLADRRRHADAVEGWSDEGLVIFKRDMLSSDGISYVPFMEAIEIDRKESTCSECDETRDDCKCDPGYAYFGPFDYECDYVMAEVTTDTERSVQNEI